jgi:hypothetical protein
MVLGEAMVRPPPADPGVPLAGRKVWIALVSP